MIALVIVTALITLYAVFMTVIWWLQKRETKALSEYAGRLKDSYSKSALATKDTQAASDELVSIAMLARADEAQRLHQTFQKFVPRQFVDHFAKGGADTLSLGYADEDEVAVMFCDVRGFTSLSEQMTPQQLMNFLNAYFMRMNAPIHDNHGFIDKFIGDAIMALFDHPNGNTVDKAIDSVRAALDMQKALRLYNLHRANSGYKSVRNGIGLHIGPVVLGTVGSDDRMDTTVIGDAVNIAQRIESLTNYFGLDILASSELVNAAKQNAEFSHRLIDKVVLKGKSISVEVHEIYEHLNDAQKRLRDASKNVILEGMSMRNAGDFKSALVLFKQAQIKHPHDSVFQHHINTCDKLMYTIDWDGNVHI